MDSRIDGNPVVPLPPLDTSIASNEAKSSPACCVCGDLEPIHMRRCPPEHMSPTDWFSVTISVGDCEETKDNCSSCALLWTISAPYRHLTVPHTTTAEIGRVEFRLENYADKLWMCIYEPGKGQTILQVIITTGTACTFHAIEPTQMVSEDTGSDQALARISHWLQECVRGHQHCNRIQLPALLPKRLVEILGPKKVVLRTTNTNTAGSYVTLSHCWGTKRFIQKTKSTLLQYQEQISWDDLPRTFKDAIDITRRLGLRYIWIDSLCIVQDDIDDWRAEGSKMASIYSASYLTIAASKSLNSAGGCFAKSAPEDVSQTYECSNANGQKYTVRVHKQLNHPESLCDFNYPLFKRAWVLQERLLSPRTVHFGPRELLWECNELRTCECTNWLSASISDPKAYILDVEAWEPDSDYIVELSTKWRALVSEYSGLVLSNEQGIFPAIQGIAKFFQKKMQCAYYAGLWERTLIGDLLWYSGGGPVTKYRSKFERAPTWSWASSGSVFWASHPGWKALATVVAISTIPVGSDPFGEICSGELQLKGRCIDAMLIDAVYTNMGNGKEDTWFSLRIANGGREVEVNRLEFKADHASSLSNNTTSKVVEMGRTFEITDIIYHSYLVVQCVDEEQQVYERIGTVTLRYGKTSRELLWHFEHHGEELVLKVV